MKNVSITVAGKDGQKVLTFKPRGTKVASRWVNAVGSANQHSTLRETDRWYNFDGHKYSDIMQICTLINNCIDEIEQIQPGLINEKVDFNNIQESVNSLHINFADRHLVDKNIPESTLELWHEFNNHLHALEAVERAQTVKRRQSSIVMTWDNNHAELLEDADYEHFTIAKKFGTCYLNYCQVGRHFFELYLSQDDVARDEHVLPLKFVSADTYIWFGTTTPESFFNERMGDIQVWFEKNKDRFNDLGFKWGDSKIGLGWLPVADLISDCKTDSDEERYVAELSSYKKIVACEVK